MNFKKLIYFVFFSTLLYTNNLYPDGPGIIPETGRLYNPKKWISFKITEKQIEFLSKNRKITLSSKQALLLNLHNPKNIKVTLVDFFDINGCTCGDGIWGVWNKKDIFSIQKRNISEISARIDRAAAEGKDTIDHRWFLEADGEISYWDPYEWTDNNLILGIDKNIYYKGQRISSSEINKLTKQKKPFKNNNTLTTNSIFI